MAVATNCSTHQSEDLKVIESLLAIRLKTKLFSNQFVGCIRYCVLCVYIFFTHTHTHTRLCMHRQIYTHTHTRTHTHMHRELISSHPANLETVLRGVVNNELGQLRSPSNIALLAMMMHCWPEEAPKVCFKHIPTHTTYYV